MMGRAIAHAGTRISTEELQEELLEEAREKGADGIIIHGFDRVQIGETTTYNEGTDQGSTTGTATTNVQEERRIEATFIKYKKNL